MMDNLHWLVTFESSSSAAEETIAEVVTAGIIPVWVMNPPPRAHLLILEYSNFKAIRKVEFEINKLWICDSFFAVSNWKRKWRRPSPRIKSIQFIIINYSVWMNAFGGFWLIWNQLNWINQEWMNKLTYL